MTIALEPAPPAMNAPAPDSLPTRNSLLHRLKDWADDASWREFFDAYWELIYNLARRAGVLQSADCSALKVLIGWKRRKQRRKWRFDKACLRRQADEHICWMPEARFKVHA